MHTVARKTGKAAGKGSWINGKVARTAAILKERNLAHANEVAGPVHPRESFYTRHGKRVLDVALSAAALVATAPINLALAVLTYRDVGSPILYRQMRSGKDLVPFELVKFRNMNEDRGPDGELLPPDERITPLGLFVRQHSLDELLNFWSVLKGDMSIIGPRPLPVEYTERMTERHKMRYAVRPGLECPFIDLDLWGEADYAQARFENDILYVETLSLATDIAQAFRLVAMVFGKRRRTGSTGTSSHFIGYDERGEAMSQGRAIALLEEAGDL